MPPSSSGLSWTAIVLGRSNQRVPFWLKRPLAAWLFVVRSSATTWPDLWALLTPRQSTCHAVSGDHDSPTFSEHCRLYLHVSLLISHTAVVATATESYDWHRWWLISLEGFLCCVDVQLFTPPSTLVFCCLLLVLSAAVCLSERNDGVKGYNFEMMVSKTIITSNLLGITIFVCNNTNSK